MTLRDLKEKARELMPWNWGKRPVRVRDQRREWLPALRGDFERLFEEFLGLRLGGRGLAPLTEPTELLGTGWPRVDLEETDDQFKVTAEVPGMDAEDVDVTIGERLLTIRGAKTGRREEHKKNYRLMETYSGRFHRTVPLPVEVDADRAEAHYKNGQLTVTLPKVERTRGRRIVVRG